MTELKRDPIRFVQGPTGLESAFCSQVMHLLRNEIVWPEDIPVTSLDDEIAWLLQKGFFIKQIGYGKKRAAFSRSLRPYVGNMLFIEDPRQVAFDDINQTLNTQGIVQIFRDYGKTPALIFDGESSEHNVVYRKYWLYEPLDSYTTDAKEATSGYNAYELTTQDVLHHPSLHIFNPQDH